MLSRNCFFLSASSFLFFSPLSSSSFLPLHHFPLPVHSLWWTTIGHTRGVQRCLSFRRLIKWKLGPILLARRYTDFIRKYGYVSVNRFDRKNYGQKLYGAGFIKRWQVFPGNNGFRRKINSTVINHRGRHRFPIQIYNYNVPRKSYFPTLSRRATSCSFLSPGLHEISWPGTTYAGLNPSPPITVTRFAPTRNTRALSRCTFRSRSEACRRARVQNVSDNNYTHEQVDSKSWFFETPR